MREIQKGATSITLNIVLRDSTTGLGKTGLIFSDITGSYTRNRAARTAITMATLASASAAWSSGGFVEIDATNCPGLYRFDVPDAAFATGVRNVVISAKATGAITEHEEVVLTGWDNQDAVRGGLTALPNAAAGATGGLACLVAFGGTATAGAASTVTLPSPASTVADFYKGLEVSIIGGTGIGQSRIITAYSGTTKVAIVSRGWRTNPDNTSVFQIKGFDFQPTTSVVGGFVQAATGTTLTLPASASAVDNYYNGALMAITGGTAVGQTRVVKSYNGTTKVVTVARPFDTTPDTTSVVVVLQAAQPAIDTNLAVDVANVNTGAIVNSSFAVDSITSASLSTGAATEIAGAVWDEARTSHTTAGSFGQGVASVQGSLTGSVGSVTGNVGGNVIGSTASVTAAVTVGTINANVITATSIATDAITAAKIAADAIGASELATDAVTEIQAAVAAGSVASVVGAVGSVTGNVGGNVVGSVGSIATGGIVAGSFAVDSITSGALSNGAADEISDHVWDEVLSGHLTAGTTGAGLNSASSAGDPWGTALPGAYGSGTAGNIIGTNVNATISSRSTVTTAQVNAEVVDALNVDTYAEPSAVPAATATLAAKIGFLMSLARNKITQTATTQLLRNSGDTATIATSTDSDDGTTFTRGGFV
jgi:hypothetical protein